MSRKRARGIALAQRRYAIGLTRGLIEQAHRDKLVASTGDYFERTTPPSLSGLEKVLTAFVVVFVAWVAWRLAA